MSYIFQFNSLNELLFMNGYGIYVWTVYIIFIVCIIYLIIHLKMKKRTIIKYVMTQVAMLNRKNRS